MRPVEAAAVLGLEMPTSIEVVKKTYKTLALQYHPDKCKTLSEADATEKFQEISKAFHVLNKYYKEGPTPSADYDFDSDIEEEDFEDFDEDFLFMRFMDMAFKSHMFNSTFGGRNRRRGSGIPGFVFDDEEDEVFCHPEILEEILMYEMAMGRGGSFFGGGGGFGFSGGYHDEYDDEEDDWGDESDEDDEDDYYYSSYRSEGPTGCPCCAHHSRTAAPSQPGRQSNQKPYSNARGRAQQASGQTRAASAKAQGKVAEPAPATKSAPPPWSGVLPEYRETDDEKTKKQVIDQISRLMKRHQLDPMNLTNRGVPDEILMQAFEKSLGLDMSQSPPSKKNQDKKKKKKKGKKK